MAILIIGGVSASGKTACGVPAAKACGVEFLDADDLHPPANVAKMRAQQPLTDEDRAPWFDAIAQRMQTALASDQHLFIACSVLKQAYRRRLLIDPVRVRIAFLVVSREEAYHRAALRSHAFFPASLVASQFADLETPQDEAGVTTIDANRPLPAVIAAVVATFRSLIEAEDSKLKS